MLIFYEQLVEARNQLISVILKSLTEKERKFLLSIKEGNPIWELIPISGLDKLPGLHWKNLNIIKMDKEKHKIALDKLKEVLQL